MISGVEGTVHVLPCLSVSRNVNYELTKILDYFAGDVNLPVIKKISKQKCGSYLNAE